MYRIVPYKLTFYLQAGYVTALLEPHVSPATGNSTLLIMIGNNMPKKTAS
jgi:hypothetical protein